MAQLIAYERADHTAQRQSDYRIVAVENADELENALTAALGVLAVVAKERHLFVWEGVRIHLDRVEELGSFIEFEAVVADGALDLAEARDHVESLQRRFKIADDDLIGGSYCDLNADATSA